MDQLQLNPCLLHLATTMSPKTDAPLVSSFNHKIRPLLDAVDRLRQLNVMQEGINLPTIVVVGDQSSGKSSVLESLAGINLPRGQGICTRVPLVMRLQNDSKRAEPELVLEYNDKSIITTEKSVSHAIVAATDEIAGNGKGISNVPLTLVVKKKDVPDLTMVDLPGITRVPVHANVDFPTCESIRMSQQVDKNGERTLAVVTKSDRSPEGLLEKVTADDVNIGLGYVCVRNRINDETYEVARGIEAEMFRSHPLLSRIDKSIVGVPVLAQKLVEIQASSIARSLPEIVKKINQRLSVSLCELNQMPQNLTSESDAMISLMLLLGRAKESLRKILIRGEFEEFPDDQSMHCTARLFDMLDDFAKALPIYPIQKSENLFLMEEISILEESKGIRLPNFLPRSAFLTVMRKNIKEIEHTPSMYVSKIWAYIDDVVWRVFSWHCENFPQLQTCVRKAIDQLIQTLKDESLEFVRIMLEMERTTDYTSNVDYSRTYISLMTQQNEFKEKIINKSKPATLNLQLFGQLNILHLRENAVIAEQAFDLKMRMTAYWKTIILRLVDGLALHVLQHEESC
ncbi:Dynamin-related protein 4C [Zostera marina]|uniref:Dynamin-related protein 4C n=1 Tax=Zostera marina TaxID=29655 RepID=A0A0K9NVG7_ZOSMR|nr:Dynamin-related protein 4C [Zostera marina]